MSYILEALKKAQTERQLGATPTIHAPTLDSGVIRSPSPGRWKPLALAVGAALAAGALVLLWRQPAAPQMPLPGQVPQTQRELPPLAAAPAAAVPASTGPAAAPGVAQVGPAAAPGAAQVVAVAASGAAPAAAITAPISAVAVASAPAYASPAAPAVTVASAAPPPAIAAQLAAPQAQPAAPVQAQAAKPAVKPTVKPAVKSEQAAEPQEEPVQLLRELPEPIQRSIPSITMGGYMYSRNPADRLVLIDKVLRREGDEVAPGLVLERLQPKAAVFTFKGYRYRVPY